MPIPLRFIGCLPVVASLLPPGTALTRLRFAQMLLLFVSLPVSGMEKRFSFPFDGFCLIWE
jgi:hypothetical protein